MTTPSSDDVSGPSRKPSFEEFYYERNERLPRWLYGKFEHRGLTIDEAFEIIGDLFCEMWEGYDRIENPAGYAYTAAVRRAVKHLNRKTNEREGARQFEERRKHERRKIRDREKIDEVAQRVLNKREYRLFELVYLDQECKLKQLAERWDYSYEYLRQLASKVRKKVREGFRALSEVKAS